MKFAIQYTPGLVNDDIWTEYPLEVFYDSFASGKVGVQSQQEKDILLGSALVFGCQWTLDITVVEDFSFAQYVYKQISYFVKVLP